MQQISKSNRKQIVAEHIRDRRTLQSLATEYGVSKATVSNWVRMYREECQTNEEEKSQMELMEEIRKLRQEKSELEKKNNFLKSGGILCKGNRLGDYRFIDQYQDEFGLRRLLRHIDVCPNAYYNYQDT